MRYVRISENSGLKVSQICLGTWHLPRTMERDEYGAYKIDMDEFKRILRYAYDAGLDFIDTANRYHGGISPVPLTHVGNSERVIGLTIKELKLDREELIVATKVGGRMSLGPNGSGLSRKHIMWQVRESLKRLQMDYIDIYYAHIFDSETPKEETLQTFDELVRAGFIRYYGMSNIPAYHLVEYIMLCRGAGFRPISVLQYRYNIIDRGIEEDIIPIAKRFGLGLTVYSPLAEGLLTGKYIDVERGCWVIPELSRASYMSSFADRYFTERNLKIVSDLVKLAESKGITPSQLALSWILQRSRDLGLTMVPIVGVSRFKHLEEALGALDVSLTGDDMKYIDELYGIHSS